VLVRRATVDDAGTVTELSGFLHGMHTEALPDIFTVFDPELTYPRFERMLAADDTLIWLAELETHAVGYACANQVDRSYSERKLRRSAAKDAHVTAACSTRRRAPSASMHRSEHPTESSCVSCFPQSATPVACAISVRRLGAPIRLGKPRMSARPCAIAALRCSARSELARRSSLNASPPGEKPPRRRPCGLGDKEALGCVQLARAGGKTGVEPTLDDLH
jgi:hypothetical protein